MNRPPEPASGAVGLRLDKWLWFARFARTRSLAAKFCAAGRVTVNGIPARKQHHVVRVGDRIVLMQGRLKHSVVVLALGERRGPPAEARLLYAEPAPAAIIGRPGTGEWVPLIDDGAPDPA